MRLRATRLAVPPVNWMPVTTVAAVALVLLRPKIVFWVTVWLGVVEVSDMPISEAAVVVPAPLLLVRLRTVFEVQVAMAFEVFMPMTCEAAPVEVNEIELATVPPTLLVVALNTFAVEVFARMPEMRNAPLAPTLVTQT